MDPFTASFLTFAGIGVLIATAKPIAVGLITFISKTHDRRKIKKAFKDGRSKKVLKAREEERIIKEIIDQNRDVKYFDKVSGKNVSLPLKEKKEFSLGRKENGKLVGGDIILKGILKHKENDVWKQESIYLYAPVLHVSGVEIGPRLNSEGNLSDMDAYLFKDNNGNIVRTYTELREVCSEMKFPYVANSRHFQGPKEFQKYFRVELLNDGKGNFVPVDLNNEQEFKEFNQYIDRISNDKMDDSSYLESMISLAKRQMQLEKEREIEEERQRRAQSYAGMKNQELQRYKQTNIHTEKSDAVKAEEERNKKAYEFYARPNYEHEQLEGKLGELLEEHQEQSHGRRR